MIRLKNGFATNPVANFCSKNYNFFKAGRNGDYIGPRVRIKTEQKNRKTRTLQKFKLEVLEQHEEPCNEGARLSGEVKQA